MKIKSQILSQASGSLGGLTAAHNRGGLYFRARTIPTNPATLQQSVVRSAMADLNNRWVNTLTAAQRIAWEVYANNVLLTDTLGEPRAVTALNMYQRSNVVAVQNSLTVVDDAPAIFDTGGPGDFDDGSSTITAASDELSLAFYVGDDWVDETGAHMIVSCSRPQNASVNFFKGPFRVVGTIAGDNSSAPTSPQTYTLPFAASAGQKVFVQTRVRRADGRLTLPFRAGIIAA